MNLSISRLRDAIKAYGQMKKAHLDEYAMLTTLRDELKAGKYQLTDMVNFIYVIREISRLADDIRKEADGISRIFENLACATYVASHQNDPERSDPIRASLATGTPNLKIGINVPNERLEPERYFKLMKFFGISEEQLESRVVKAYWPGLCEQISKLAEEGKPLPPGISVENTYPTYSVTIKMIQNLDEVLRKMKGRRAETCAKILATRPIRQSMNEE
jgi:hypothetical protein